MRNVGYYVHHVGSGHRHRATVLAAELAGRGVAVTGLSSLSRPAEWCGEWVGLERDDGPAPGPSDDVSAHDQLHWVPLHHDGLMRRSARVSRWLDATRPDLVISDVSQEVTLLCRLHGVPVVSVVLPGRRLDPGHALGLRLSAGLVAFWPAAAQGMSVLPEDVAPRVRPLGGLSRFAPVAVPLTRGASRLVVLAGSGGGADRLAAVGEAVTLALPGWTSTVLGGESWVADPFTLLQRADVVISHAGQNALAEIASARVPAVIVPQARPHDEQVTTAAALGDDAWPALVVGDPDATDWADLVRRAAQLDGDRWRAWVDGSAASRFADVIGQVCA